MTNLLLRRITQELSPYAPLKYLNPLVTMFRSLTLLKRTLLSQTLSFPILHSLQSSLQSSTFTASCGARSLASASPSLSIVSIPSLSTYNAINAPLMAAPLMAAPISFNFPTFTLPAILEGLPFLWRMNRNARRGKKANKMKRPCSNVARRKKKRDGKR